MNILNEILAHKRQEVDKRKARISESAFREMAAENPPPGGFRDALLTTISQQRPAIIAELKRASPSRGIIREDFQPTEIAANYQRGGASALSVLTDSHYFKGSGVILEFARRGSSLPILRKDFIIDPYQIYESCAMGAAAILLIAAALDDDTLRELRDLARSQGLDVLVEVHDAEELARAKAIDADMIGINNRDMKTFEVSLDTTLTLAEQISEDCVAISESGICTADDIATIRAAGIHAFLVGESLMRSEDPGAQLAELLEGS